jgi:hypothetical protein
MDPDKLCQMYPCPHTESLDHEEELRDPSGHVALRKFFNEFRFRHSLRCRISDEEFAGLTVLLNRC